MLKWPKAGTLLHLAHPCELLPAESWHQWQRFVFDRKMVQPFKQVFREVYLSVGEEKKGKVGRITRFSGDQILPRQALAILGKCGWVVHPEDGLYRLFRSDGIGAWLNFEEAYRGLIYYDELTVDGVTFTGSGKAGKSLGPCHVPGRVFSEVARNIDLIVSVAHASGAAPEMVTSSLEMRAVVVRETCRLLKLENVTLDGKYVRIQGTLGDYRIHLGSGVVHRDADGMIAMKSERQNERGRIFLPFADDDPRTVEVLSRVLLFAKDDKIRDPKLAKLLRS